MKISKATVEFYNFCDDDGDDDDHGDGHDDDDDHGNDHGDDGGDGNPFEVVQLLEDADH